MSCRMLATLLLLVCLFGAPFALTYVNACRTLNTAGETYVVNVSTLNSVDTCFNITANNIVLDCNGSWINFALSAGGPSYGAIINGASGVTVRNCRINGNGKYDEGIFINASDGASILNCQIKDLAGDAAGIYLLASENAIIRNLTTSNCDYGIYIGDGYYGADYASSFSLYGSDISFNQVGVHSYGGTISALIDGCEFDGNGTGYEGIDMASYNGTIRNNVVHSVEASCMRLGYPGGDDNVFHVNNNSIYECGQDKELSYAAGGVFLFNNAHNSVVWNNTVRDSNGIAYIDHYTLATNNTFHSNIAYNMGLPKGGGFYCTYSSGHTAYNNSVWNLAGVGFTSSCDGAKIYNNSVRNASKAGFAITGTNVELYNNTASQSPIGFGIAFPGSSGWISVHGNTAHSNSQFGFELVNGGSPDQTYPMQGNTAWNNSIAGFDIWTNHKLPLMENNTARNNSVGVWFNGSSGGVFSDCNVYENQVGILFSGDGALVDNCDIYSNTNSAPHGGTGVGVAFQSSSGNKVSGSRIYGNQIGAFFNDSENDTINTSDIYGNTREGVWITSDAYMPQLLSTDIYNNTGLAAPDGIYMDAEGNCPDLTMDNLRVFGNAAFQIEMRNYAPCDEEPPFILSNSTIVGELEILNGSSGQITNTYIEAIPRGNYFAINLAPGSFEPIQATNLGIGLPNSEAALGVGSNTTQYGYIVFPSVELVSLRLAESDTVLGTNFVSLLPRDYTTLLDGPAEAHTQVAGCNGITYYYLDHLPTTYDSILQDGTQFTPAYSECSGGWVMFATPHFTGYAANGTPSAHVEEGGQQYECMTNADCSGCKACNDHNCTLSEGSCNTASDCKMPTSSSAVIPASLFLCKECKCVPIECTDNTQCDEGYTCENNKCVPPECIKDADCPSGYTCKQFSCVPPECTKDSDCGANEACRNYKCTGKGGEQQTGEVGNITPVKPPEETPPFITPVEIGQEVLPLVQPEEQAKPPEGGMLQTAATAGAAIVAFAILGALIYFIATKKKKKKVKGEEAD